MKCDCGGDLKARRSFTVGNVRYQERLCSKCGTQHAYTLLRHDGEESAYALAQKARAALTTKAALRKRKGED